MHYRVTVADPRAHLFTVTCRIRRPAPDGETLSLPAWIPGSYLIRDFARHIVRLSATADGQPVAAVKCDQHSWHLRAPKGCRTLEVRYDVYAWDLSVRGAHLDETHAFFNGTSLFLRVAGREQRPCAVELVRPAGAAFRQWQVATTLPPARGRLGAPPWGFGRYVAGDYAELIDHPVEMGCFEKIEFAVRGIPHAVAITGRIRCDLPRLARDLAKVCAGHIDFWGGKPPFDRYLFLVTAVGEGYGGLEHRNSTALLCRRQDLPNPLDHDINDDYRTFLGLASHEYFHSWNVKCLRPADFDTLDLQRENPTELLWFFEGFTAYYDDLALVRCGLIGEQRYLDLLAETVSRVAGTPGRHVQSVAAASFDAWSKFYRPDENTPNITVSYYAKGALVALALDLRLRTRSEGRASLDGVMRRLWARFGDGCRGLAEADILAAVEDEAGFSGARRWLRAAVHGTADLPLPRLMGQMGLKLTAASGPTVGLGLKLDTGADAKIQAVFRGGAAMAAGLAGGDTLVALDGLRVTAANIESLLARYRPGEVVEIHAFRRDELRRFALTVPDAAAGRWQISIDANTPRGPATLRNAWLHGPPPPASGARPKTQPRPRRSHAR